jgi:hypothetical protein
MIPHSILIALRVGGTPGRNQPSFGVVEPHHRFFDDAAPAADAQ